MFIDTDGFQLGPRPPQPKPPRPGERVLVWALFVLALVLLVLPISLGSMGDVLRALWR